MSKEITIPNFADPVVVTINNESYMFKAGTTVTVSDEVACVIENIIDNLPKPVKEPGEVGQVWTRTEKGAEWQDIPEAPVEKYYLHKLNISVTAGEEEFPQELEAWLNYINKSQDSINELSKMPHEVVLVNGGAYKKNSESTAVKSVYFSGGEIAIEFGLGVSPVSIMFYEISEIEISDSVSEIK